MVRLPGTPREFKLSKLDMIGHHLTAAVQMMAIKCNPYSTHVIVKAAHEMIEVMAKKKDVPLAWGPEIHIKDEHIAEYRKLANKAYNYLKHADKDLDAPYDGPKFADLRKLNVTLSLLNLNGYQALGGKVSPTHLDFVIMALIQRPEYFKDDFIDSMPGLRERLAETSKDSDIMLMALRQRMVEHGTLPRD